MRFIVTAVITCCLFIADLDAQSYVFGVKGGLAMGLQQWNGYQRDPLFRYHGDVFIESWSEENKYSLYAALGYHVRGASIRTREWVDDNGQVYDGGVTNMEFHNLVLSLGGKQKFPVGVNSMAYYLVGIRGEYTVNTHFDGYMTSFEGEENKFVFGVSVGGGFEVPFSRWTGAIFEISVHPDFTKQMFIPMQSTGYYDSFGKEIFIQEQNVNNLTIEFTVGFRFFREIIYID